MFQMQIARLLYYRPSSNVFTAAHLSPLAAIVHAAKTRSRCQGHICRAAHDGGSNGDLAELSRPVPPKYFLTTPIFYVNAGTSNVGAVTLALPLPLALGVAVRRSGETWTWAVAVGG